ncbi:hypothetical protein VE02_07022 [Pseudogymnoascus sp. 03VT05]|nr:hypothetical protein VE02_07022 [Pseudogymnoascus sp. 03VT05]
MQINSLPPNGHKGQRLSINLLLNPVEDAASRPPQRTSDVVVLPPFSYLDQYTSPGPNPQPTHYYQDHPRFRQYRNHNKYHSSPSSSSSCCSTPRSSRSLSPASPSHSNIPYTLEQVHFIQYYREDKGAQWQAIVGPFMRQFPRVVLHQSNVPKRGKGALECRYYRAQMFPKFDDQGNFVRDHNDEYEMVNIKVRERKDHPYKAILDDYIKLVTRCPEVVLKYSWTDEEAKAEARSIIANRARQGRGELPGAIIRVRTTTF